MQKKLVMLFVAIILAFVVLIGRITYINVFKGGKYTRIVLNQQQYGSRTIPYKRGDIVDRNGTKVATSERVYNVILDVVVVTDEGESDKYIDSTLDVCLSDMCKALRTGRDFRANCQQQYHVLEILTSFEKSSREGKFIPLTTHYTRTAPTKFE